MTSSRGLRRTAGITVLLVAVLAVLAGCTTGPPSPPASGVSSTNPAAGEPGCSPSDAATRPGGLGSSATTTEFGFVRGFEDDEPDLDTFVSDVNLMTANGQQWIRFRLASHLLVAGGTGSDLVWNEENLRRYDEAINYAFRSGLKIYLVTTGPPDWTQEQAFDTYVRTTAAFWQFLAQRYGACVSVWQLYNEADAGHYRFYDDVELTPAYLDELTHLIDVGREAIKAVNPAVAITTSTMGWPIDDATQDRWFTYFDAIGARLDAVTLDLYTGDDPETIETVGSRVSAVRERYDKPVIIGETGMQTCSGCWTEETQAEIMPEVLTNLRSAGPAVITYFYLRDESADPSDGEGSFGILRHDGTPKIGFDPILSVMRRRTRRNDKPHRRSAATRR